MRRYAMVAPRSRTFVAFGRKQIMGWAMIFVLRGKNYCNIFVNKRFRNRGVAAKLIEAAVRNERSIVLAAHDETTRHLFPKMKKKYPQNIAVLDWKKHRERMARAIVLQLGYKLSFFELMQGVK